MKQQSADTILKNFKTWVNSHRNNKEMFYVGMTDDINSVLRKHNVTVQYKTAKTFSVNSAIDIVKSMKEWGCSACDLQEESEHIFVYIYQKTNYTLET